MNDFREWVGEWETEIKAVLDLIIGIVAVIVIGIQINKAMWATKSHKSGEVIKAVVFALVAGLIGAVGIAGVHGMVNRLKPDNQLVPTS